MHPRRGAAVVAVVVLAIGLLLVLLPLSAGTVHCGSAFDPSAAEAIVEDIVNGGDHVARFEEAVSDRRLFASSIAGLGALALLFLWLTGQHTTRWDAATEPEETSDDRS